MFLQNFFVKCNDNNLIIVQGHAGSTGPQGFKGKYNFL